MHSRLRQHCQRRALDTAQTCIDRGPRSKPNFTSSRRNLPSKYSFYFVEYLLHDVGQSLRLSLKLAAQNLRVPRQGWVVGDDRNRGDRCDDHQGGYAATSRRCQATIATAKKVIG